MRAFILIIFFLFVLCQDGVGQVKSTSAVMRVSATIVSGATLETVQPITIKLDTNTETSGRFEFVTTKHAVTHVETSSYAQLTNQYGEKINITTDSLHKSKNGRHSVDIEARIDQNSAANLKGTYTGSITTSINYL